MPFPSRLLLGLNMDICLDLTWWFGEQRTQKNSISSYMVFSVSTSPKVLRMDDSSYCQNIQTIFYLFITFTPKFLWKVKFFYVDIITQMSFQLHHWELKLTWLLLLDNFQYAWLKLWLLDCWMIMQMCRFSSLPIAWKRLWWQIESFFWMAESYRMSPTHFILKDIADQFCQVGLSYEHSRGW